MRTPAIANAEIHRLAPPEQLGILRLVPSREFGNRTGIAAERKEPPFLRIITAERNAGIVLDDGGAVGKQKVAHRSEEHTSELQSQSNLVCRLLLETKTENNT